MADFVILTKISVIVSVILLKNGIMTELSMVLISVIPIIKNTTKQLNVK